MKFKEFINRTSRYMDTILDIGKEEFNVKDFKIYVSQQVQHRGVLTLAETFTAHQIIRIHYDAFVKSVGFCINNFRRNPRYPRLFKDHIPYYSYTGMNDTEIMKNLMIEVFIHELFHLNQYTKPLYHINSLSAIANNDPFLFSRAKYMHDIELPVQYETNKFLIKHEEELKRRFHYAPGTFDSSLMVFVMINEVKRLIKEKYPINYFSYETCKGEILSGIKDLMFKTEGKFSPYKKASVDYLTAINIACEFINEEIENNNVRSKEDIASKYLKHYDAVRIYASKYRKEEKNTDESL